MRKAAWSALALLLAACAAPGASITPAQLSTTPAGPSSAPASGSSPATALDADLQGPRGLAFDDEGNLYVTECKWTWGAIDRIDTNGKVTPVAGTGAPGFAGDGGPATEAQLKCPTGVAVGPDGAVYFADHLSNRVRRVDPAGVITTFAGGGATGLNEGSFAGDGGPATQATLQGPWGVAFDQTGRLYIADRDNVRVRRVGADGDIMTIAGVLSCPPVGVAINPGGDLVIPDACSSAIRMVDADGTITTIAETDSRDSPQDVGSEGNAIFDSTGSMVVQAGPRIFRIDASGALTPVAGNGSVGVPVDGSSAVDAPLPVEIWGLAADPDGNVYVADGATSVWRIDVQGIITRFAGKL